MKLLHLLTCSLVASASLSPAHGSDAAREIQSYLDSLASENKLSGVVLVAKDGVPIATKAAGVANKATGAPIRLDTRFNIGSMNKMFTSVAIAQLAQAGRLKFDEPISKHLPDYANKEIADKVTIHHLLTHTSGMGMYTGHPEFRAQRARLTTVTAHLPFIVNEPLAFEPGARFQYSNSGFMVLGAIIEKISGQDYHSYVQQQIYKPAGMVNTGFYQPGRAIENLAVGYTRMGADGQRTDQLSENTERIEIRGGPAGGGYSTAEDLVKFHSALRGFKLLNREYTDIVTTGKFDVGGPIGRYAYGFGDKVVEGKRIVGHNGGWPGIAVQLDMYPDTGHTAVVLMNADPPNMMPVVMRLRQLIPAK
jgi:CubicO group peptidase (beta-lactamase class C family)